MRQRLRHILTRVDDRILLPIGLLLAALLAAMLSGCDVHEFPGEPDAPEPEPEQQTIKVNIHHEQTWTHSDFVYSRAGETLEARYVLRAYTQGTTENHNYEAIFYSTDLNRADFTIDLPLPEGRQDIHVFSDYVEAGTHRQLHYDVTDFSSISNIRDQYEGNTDSRDAFATSSQFSIPSAYSTGDMEITLSLSRPMARYVIVATDADRLADKVAKSSDGARTIDGYTVIVRYPLYMPSNYSMFSQAPTDSWTGMSYEAPVERTSDSEAQIGMDYMWVNHHEGSLQMQLYLRNPQGETVPMTSVFTVPMVRGRTTWIRGPFLTSTSTGGVGIDPGFDGDFNIEIR